jgi:hypothetical protein
LRQLQREQGGGSKYVFATERGGPFTTDAINRQIKTIGQRVSADLILDQNHRFQFASQRVPTLWI